MSTHRHTVRVGFIPLIDCAPLIVAHELGFAAEENLEIALARETSWATIRDRLAVGHLDAAHLLAPMPIAAALGLNPLPHDLIVPIALGSGGNTVTIARGLWPALEAAGAAGSFDAGQAVRALASVVASRRRRAERRLVLGIVHPYSAHHYELAYWLAVGGIMPGRDVELVVVPPSLMPAALASGRIDGFCAGEPWGSVAVDEGTGVILTTKAHIWRSAPEKVIAVSRLWQEQHGVATTALVRAIYKAAAWCDDAGNHEPLADILGQPHYLAQPADRLHRSLGRRLPSPDGDDVAVPGLLRFAENAATFPWVSHALWFYTQMVRWRQIDFDASQLDVVRRTWRPDLYREALAPLGVAMPGANAKVEGALATVTPVGSSTGDLSLSADTFFDGQVFDPDRVEAYIAACAPPVDLPVPHRSE